MKRNEEILRWANECKSSYRSMTNYSYIVDALAKDGYKIIWL